MNKIFEDAILSATGASALFEIEIIQSLWSGYGKIVRYGLKGSAFKTVVVKHVQLAIQNSHPRGWDTDLSHERKLKSYQVETAWYNNWSSLADNSCRLPKCLTLKSVNNEVLMVLEDLNGVGYPSRKNSVSWENIKVCLSWLANFHATYLNRKPTDLWETGTYWHLATRPDEFKLIADKNLKLAASKIDRKLSDSPFQTIVHGDAKLANFCFSKDGLKVSAVDFQYVGGGCGMKDIAYFIGSCLNEDDCEKLETKILDFYFSELTSAIKTKQKDIDSIELEKNWRELYHVAWTDFHRFLKGWSPDHWKINSYSERISREVIKDLE